jgi:hypothetical protein
MAKLMQSQGWLAELARMFANWGLSVSGSGCAVEPRAAAARTTA